MSLFKVRQSTFSSILSISSILLVILLLIFTFLRQKSFDETNRLYNECSELVLNANGYRDTSAYLTSEARAYAVTGNKTHVDNYNNEIDIGKNRQHFMEKLRAFELSTEELMALELMQTLSENLVTHERDAITNASIGDNESAIAALYSEFYQSAIDKIASLHRQFLSLADTRLMLSIKDSLNSSSRCLTVCIILLALLVSVVTVTILYYRIYIIKPLVIISKEMSDISSGNLLSEANLTPNDTEIGTLIKAVQGTRADIAACTSRLNELAFKDTFTGLYNMQYVIDNLKSELSTDLSRNKNIGVIAMDIKGFKNLNNSFGMKFGNEVIFYVIDQIKSMFDNRTIIRASVDKFFIIYADAKNIEMLEEEAARIKERFDHPHYIANKQVYISFCFGVAYESIEDGDLGSLLQASEFALKHSKHCNDGGIAILNDGLREKVFKELQIEFDLKGAITNNELMLYYQPIINGHTAEVSGAEVLLRWNHMTRGFISPNVFIPLAE